MKGSAEKRGEEGPIPLSRKRGRSNVLERLDALNGKERHAILATASDNQPYASLIAYALTPQREIIFSTPKKTRKYNNILQNRNVAVIIDTRSNTDSAYLGAEALTLLGRAHPARRGRKWNERANILMKKHPYLKSFIHAPSSALIVIEIRHCVHVNRFQEVTEWGPD